MTNLTKEQHSAICAVIDRVKLDDHQLDTDEYVGMVEDALNSPTKENPVAFAVNGIADIFEAELDPETIRRMAGVSETGLIELFESVGAAAEPDERRRRLYRERDEKQAENRRLALLIAFETFVSEVLNDDDVTPEQAMEMPDELWEDVVVVFDTYDPWLTSDVKAAIDKLARRIERALDLKDQRDG